MLLNKNQSAKAVGISRTTLDRHIKEGKLSVQKDGSGKCLIDISELQRVYTKLNINETSNTVHTVQNGTSNKNKPFVTEVNLLHEQINLLKNERERERRQFETIIDDLRTRLDQESEERRKTQTQLTALLTDMRTNPPKKPADSLRVRLGRWIAGNP